MIEFFQRGGVIMYPILFCSLVLLAVIMERVMTLYFSINRILPRGLLVDLAQALQSSNRDQAIAVCKKDQSMFAMIVLAGLEKWGRPRDVVREALVDTGRIQAQRLEKFLPAISTIAGISPLLGLLGTVLGMIKIFNVIFIEGLGSASRLAGGISEALITTVAGLTVAIPAFTAYKFFSARVGKLTRQMELESMNVLDGITEEG